MSEEFSEEKIIAAIIDMRLKKSMSHKNIIDFLNTNLGMGKATAYTLITKAQDEIKEGYKKLSEGAIEESILQIEEKMQQANKDKNYKFWLELRKELNKIKGVYAAEKLDIKGDLNHNITVIKLNGPGHEDGVKD